MKKVNWEMALLCLISLATYIGGALLAVALIEGFAYIMDLTS